MQDEVNTKVVAIAIKGGKITAEVLKKALAKFNEINWKLKEAVRLFNEKYGPITADQNLSENNFYWVDDPWPWERGANQ